MKIKALFFLLLTLTLPNCGFKAVDQNFLKDFKFVETNITGDNRLNYLLRNRLKVESENATKSIKVEINTSKNKTIKEKNIQNEITKYEIKILANVKYYFIEDNKSGEFSISKSENYNVGSKYSDTVNNEKKLIKTLIKDIADEILENLKLSIDEL